MPGHEFEKNVQQRLDELKLRPSEAVWNNVERSIRDDKRRRRMIIWLPILLLFLGTSGYFLINKNGFISAETAVKRNQNEKKNNLTSNPESKQDNNTDKLQKENSSTDNNHELITKNPSDNSIAKNHIAKKSILNNKRSLMLAKNKSAKPETIVKNRNDNPLLAKDAQPIKAVNVQPDLLSLNNDENPIKYADVNLSLIKGASPFVSLTIPEKTTASLETPAVDMKSLSKLNQKNVYNSSKWQWGLDLSIGTSNAADEVSFLGSAQLDNGGRTSNVGGGVLQASDMVTTIEPGMHWSAGGFIQRNFTNRFALSAGLEYSQYSTGIITSTRVNTNRLLFNSFVAADPNGKANEYTNRYYFLELPVTAHFKLNKSNNFPVYANTGLSIAWLLAANSLNYQSNIFSNQSNELYNNTQMGFHGGFTFGLLNKSKHPLQIGPSIRYNFSRLIKNSSSNQHLVSFGLDARLLLKK